MVVALSGSCASAPNGSSHSLNCGSGSGLHDEISFKQLKVRRTIIDSDKSRAPASCAVLLDAPLRPEVLSHLSLFSRYRLQVKASNYGTTKVDLNNEAFKATSIRP